MRDIVHITYGDLDNKTILESDTGKLEVQTDDTIGRTAEGKLTIVGSTELDTKEDKGVVSRVVRLLTNENLDTLIGETIHARQDLDSNILNDMNYPVLEAGYFENLYSGADGGNSQRYTTYITDIIFTRRYTIMNGWSSWKEIGSGGAYTLPPATTTTLGGVKPDGTTITVTADGTITSIGGTGGSYTLPPATTTTLGGVIVGDGLNVTSDGTLSIDMATNVDVIPTVIHAGVVDHSITIIGSTMYITFAIEEGTVLVDLESLIEWDAQYLSLNKVNISTAILGIDGNSYNCGIDANGSKIYIKGGLTTAFGNYINESFLLVGDFGVPVIEGGVSSANGVLPDTNGNVQLVPDDIGAFSSSGGNIYGHTTVVRPAGETFGYAIVDDGGTDYIQAYMSDTEIRWGNYNVGGVSTTLAGIDRATGNVASQVFPILNNSNTFTGNLVSSADSCNVTVQNPANTNDRIYMYHAPSAVGIYMKTNVSGEKDVVSYNKTTGAVTSGVFLLQTTTLLDNIQNIPQADLIDYKEEMQDKIVELEIKLERANSKGFVELVAKLQSQLDILNTKLGEVI